MSVDIETDHPCTQFISGRDDVLPWIQVEQPIAPLPCAKRKPKGGPCELCVQRERRQHWPRRSIHGWCAFGMQMVVVEMGCEQQVLLARAQPVHCDVPWCSAWHVPQAISPPMRWNLMFRRQPLSVTFSRSGFNSNHRLVSYDVRSD